MKKLGRKLLVITLGGCFILTLMINIVIAAGVTPETVSITPELVDKARKEGSLILQYTEPIKAMTGFVQKFKKHYPGIEVLLERKAGSKGAYSLLQEIRANVHRVDVYSNSDLAASVESVKNDAFAAVVPSNINDFPPETLGVAPSVAKNYLYADRYNFNVVAYNPKFVSEAEAELLKEWSNILDPRFKGKISLVEPVFGVTLNPLMAIMKQPNLGIDLIKKLKAQEPIIYINTAQARDALVAGQQPISWACQWEGVMFTLVQTGAPVRFVYPNPTAIYSGAFFAILKKAPHPNAARLFWAWALSREGGLAHQMPNENKRSILKSVPETREIVKKLLKETSWYQPPKATIQAPIEEWIENVPKYQKMWRDALDYNP